MYVFIFVIVCMCLCASIISTIQQAPEQTIKSLFSVAPSPFLPVLMTSHSSNSHRSGYHHKSCRLIFYIVIRYNIDIHTHIQPHKFTATILLVLLVLLLLIIIVMLTPSLLISSQYFFLSLALLSQLLQACSLILGVPLYLNQQEQNQHRRHLQRTPLGLINNVCFSILDMIDAYTCI